MKLKSSYLLQQTVNTAQSWGGSQGDGGGPGRGEAQACGLLELPEEGQAHTLHPEPSAVAAGPVRLLISHTLLGRFLRLQVLFPCL